MQTRTFAFNRLHPVCSIRITEAHYAAPLTIVPRPTEQTTRILPLKTAYTPSAQRLFNRKRRQRIRKPLSPLAIRAPCYPRRPEQNLWDQPARVVQNSCLPSYFYEVTLQYDTYACYFQPGIRLGSFTTSRGMINTGYNETAAVFRPVEYTAGSISQCPSLKP